MSAPRTLHLALLMTLFAVSACGTESGAGNSGSGGQGASDAGSGAGGDYLGPPGTGGANGLGGFPTDGGSAPGGSGGQGGAASTVVALFDFDNELVPTGFAVGNGTITPTQGYETLGTAGNVFGTHFLRSETANVITVTLVDLPPHTMLSLDMLFAAIDSLDGTGSFPAGDFFRVTLDGEEIFRESFANATAEQIQSYVPPTGVELARRIDLGFSGPGGYYTDSAYDFSQDPAFHDLPHTADTAVLVFTLEGEGVQSLDDESWAIDNVRVTLD